MVQSLGAESKVDRGFIELNEPDKLYHLVGKWLYKKETKPNQQPDPLSKNWNLISVPGIWYNLGVEHRGALWYKLDFRIYRNLAGKDLGLMLPNTAFAHEIYLNGKFLAGRGKFSPDGSILERSTQASFTTLPKNLILPKGKNTIFVRVGSYGGVGGFNLGDVYLGKKDIVLEKFLRNLLWNTTIVAIFVFVGFYHFVIYLARKKDREYLYYSMMCFVLALYNLCFTTLSYWIWDNFWFYYFGTIVSVNSLPIFLILFFHKFLEHKKNYISKAIIATTLFLLVIGIILNTTTPENFYRFNSFVLRLILIVLGVSLLYPIYFIIKGIRKGRIGNYLVLAGYTIFGLASTNDILIYLNIYDFYKFVEVGFFAFIMSISLAMALKFAHVHQELEYLTQNLTDEVQKRTKELTETNLRLVQMDKVKTSFFANVTHELRTPLTLSLVPIEKLLQETSEPNHLKLLDTAHRNNIKLLKLINDLLDFAKIESGLMDIRLTPTNLSRLLEGLVSHFQMNAEAKGLVVESHIQPDLNISIDPEKVEKIITNLLTNSYKFTENGGKIYIELKELQKSNTLSHYCILVRDTGIGIPEDRLGDVFQRFHQVDMTKERNYEGSGIGLSLVKELTEMHNGYVEVDSRLGEGSEFRIYIPHNKISYPKDLNFNESLSEDISGESQKLGFSHQVLENLTTTQHISNTNFESNKPKILIVEDNDEMVYLLYDLLNPDYDLIITKNGFTGLEKALNLRPDLIVSDVMMPGMNGFEFTRNIKQDPILRQTPVILLTAMNDLDGKLEGFTTGVDDYISKPFQPLELKARIQNLIQKSNLQNEKNHRLNQLQKELILARDIQSQLLPQKLPSIPELSIASLYIPLDEVGGDFYDIHIEPDSIFIFTCDVSGHGVPACLIASMVKMAFQNQVRENLNQNIAEILQGINNSLYNIIGNNFVTASLANIIPSTGKVYSVTAGHPPFYHITRGNCIPIHTKGRPLGLFESFESQIHETYLKNKDTIFFYTDGIIETSNSQGDMYGEERLEEFLKKHSNISAEEMLDALTQELRGFLGDNHFDDDITALVLKFHSTNSAIESISQD